ncbi:hypothetical protein ABZ352_18875 [Streptomyces griseofuscus]|uniref:hypothetical protein n=1 Tax=Streptomyces griseofuscus TaxID=146922 RepID=UPI0033E2A99A
MTEDYRDTMVGRHTEEYVVRFGRHPYTDCWPWAEAALAWSRANEQHLGWSLRNAHLGEDDLGHVVAALAETFRLNMARHARTPGDLDLDNARSELGYWASRHGSYPKPGTPGWPEPSGPYADRWRSAFLSGDPLRPERLARGAGYVLHGLLFHTAKLPERGADLAYRLDTYDCTYVALAEAAPSIGITAPVQVADPLCYRSIRGLIAVPVSPLVKNHE